MRLFTCVLGFPIPHRKRRPAFAGPIPSAWTHVICDRRRARCLTLSGHETGRDQEEPMAPFTYELTLFAALSGVFGVALVAKTRVFKFVEFSGPGARRPGAGNS